MLMYPRKMASFLHKFYQFSMESWPRDCILYFHMSDRQEEMFSLPWEEVDFCLVSYLIRNRLGPGGSGLSVQDPWAEKS